MRYFYEIVLMAMAGLAIAQRGNAQEERVPISDDAVALISIIEEYEQQLSTAEIAFTVKTRGRLDGQDLSWVTIEGTETADFAHRNFKLDIITSMEPPKYEERPPRSWNRIFSKYKGDHYKFSAYELEQPTSKTSHEWTNKTAVIFDDGVEYNTEEVHSPSRFLLQNCWLGNEAGARPLSAHLRKGALEGRLTIDDDFSVHSDDESLDQSLLKVQLKLPMGNFTLYLDTARGYNIVRSVNTDYSPVPQLFSRVHDVSLDLINGVWVPVKATYSSTPGNDGKLSIHETFTLKYQSINEPLVAADFEIVFPAGTQISDGRTGAELFVRADEATMLAVAKDIHRNRVSTVGQITKRVLILLTVLAVTVAVVYIVLRYTRAHAS